MKSSTFDPGLRNVGVNSSVCVLIIVEYLSRKPVLYVHHFILNTKYTLSIKFVPAQVRGNNH